jgi:hypothetical protein
MRARRLLLLPVVAACSRAPNTPGYVDVPGNPLLEIQVPAGVHRAKRGFESSDKRLNFSVWHARGDDASDLSSLKAKLGENVKTWLSTDTTPDGFVATYSMAQTAFVQVEDPPDGEKLDIREYPETYAVRVRRTIRGRIYMCGGGNLPTKESLDPIIKACASVKAK